MIKSVHISNYALIENVDLELSEGLNIITGETGAGKSIMLGALSLLLGERADYKVVSDQSKKSVVEAVIEVDNSESLDEFFVANSLDQNDDGTVILRRELSQSGRSRAFINDSPVTLVQLEALSKQLIDIHSQHQNLLLANPEFQLRIIDAMAADSELLEEYRAKYKSYRATLRSYSALKKKIETLKGKEELLVLELEKIKGLKLKPYEQEELEKERETLSNYTSIKESLNIILNNLSGEEQSALDRLRTAEVEAEEIEAMVPDGKSLAERLNSVLIELSDIAGTYESLNSEMIYDPKRLDYLDERLDNIYRLQKRHNVDNINGLLKVSEKISSDLNSIEEGESQLRELQKEAKQKRTDVLECARRLSDVRRKGAEKFMNDLQEKAAPLGMKNIKALAEFNYSSELTPDGIDKIEFKFSFNKNQEPLPISKTASGGEISRLMLCIKSILANRVQLPTIVFDEVDSGVSGEIANRMGEMMLDISEGLQVIAITHLPQVASKGKIHFKVYKEDDEIKTNTRLISLDEEGRIKELALMLSGSSIDEASLANARSLLYQNKR